MVNNICEICSAASFKYKCPKCFIKYCSVTCYNCHKASECNAPNIQKDDLLELNKKEYFFVTKDTVLSEKLSLLGKSHRLVGLLKDNELRHILTVIDSASDQSKTIQEAMQNPIFVQFVDECLLVVEN